MRLEAPSILPASHANGNTYERILSFNLDWQYVMVGLFISITLELCGIKALAFAIGLYLPLATTLPIFVGGAIKGFLDWRTEMKNGK